MRRPVHPAPRHGDRRGFRSAPGVLGQDEKGARPRVAHDQRPHPRLGFQGIMTLATESTEVTELKKQMRDFQFSVFSHYCPVKFMAHRLKPSTGAGFHAMKGGVDLNRDNPFVRSSGFLPGGWHAYRQDPVRSVDGLSAVDNIYPTRCALWRRSGREDVRV